jgi:CRISPR system Cascade subunit CasE
VSLYMIQLGVRQRYLQQWAHEGNFNARDGGYLVHAAMRASFGGAAPQPFALMPGGQLGELNVLGYSATPKEYLLEQRQALAVPVLAEAFPHGGILDKRMPDTWRAGSAFCFEVRFCPVSRLSMNKNGKRRTREKDAFLTACDRQQTGDPPLIRDQVYLDWLEYRLTSQGAVSLLGASMESFHLVKPVRRRQRPGKATYLSTHALRPDVLVRGRLKVEASQGFTELLAKGIGRHKAFGYGMLLIKPDHKPGTC